jgi:hypothetical protein
MRDIDDAGWVEDEPSRQRQQRERANSLEKALTALRLIAKDLRLEDPDAEAKKIKNRLLRRIAQQGAARVRDRRYDAYIFPWRSGDAARPNARWACHLVRLESNLRSIGRLRGPHPLSRKEAIERAINNAASVKAEELTPVERRAVEMLERGAGKRQRVKPRKIL